MSIDIMKAYACFDSKTRLGGKSFRISPQRVVRKGSEGGKDKRQ